MDTIDVISYCVASFACGAGLTAAYVYFSLRKAFQLVNKGMDCEFKTYRKTVENRDAGKGLCKWSGEECSCEDASSCPMA